MRTIAICVICCVMILAGAAIARADTVIEGRDFTVDTCTLTANAASTTCTAPTVTSSSKIFLFPTTANAAADLGSATSVYISAKTAETSFTVTHPNNANANKTFNYLVVE